MPHVGWKHSEETKQKMRGHKLSEKTKERMRESRKQHLATTTPEERRLLYGSFIGRKHTLETLKKMSETKRGKKRPPFSNEWRQNISRGLARAFVEGRRNWVTRPHYVNGWFWSSKNREAFYFRSSMELDAMKILECHPKVLSWESEPFSVEYEMGGRISRYILDFLAVVDGHKNLVIEVKPFHECQDLRNHLKWRAAKLECKRRGERFAVWTERHLKDLWWHVIDQKERNQLAIMGA